MAYHYDATDSKAHVDIGTVHADPDCHHLRGAERVFGILEKPDGASYCGTCCDVGDGDD
jgi:hypothetical protein